jgi:NAD(P)-dependent dehydrogenase (short-subunit alcohol dehydrogenase family)
VNQLTHFGLEDRRVIVFGGQSPLALACIDSLLKESANTLLISRNRSQDVFNSYLDQGVRVEELDLLSLDRVPRFNEVLNSFKPDTLIFANRSRSNSLQTALETDVIATSQLAELFAQSRTTRTKSLVFVTSPVSRVVQLSKQPLGYHLAKAAIVQLSRYIAVNFATYSTRANCVSPGAFIEKARSQSFFAEQHHRKLRIQDAIPIGRFGTVVDVANVILFLISNAAEFINGQEILVDGGFYSIDSSVFLDP